MYYLITRKKPSLFDGRAYVTGVKLTRYHSTFSKRFHRKELFFIIVVKQRDVQ